MKKGKRRKTIWSNKEAKHGNGCNDEEQDTKTGSNQTCQSIYGKAGFAKKKGKRKSFQGGKKRKEREQETRKDESREMGVKKKHSNR